MSNWHDQDTASPNVHRLAAEVRVPVPDHWYGSDANSGISGWFATYAKFVGMAPVVVGPADIDSVCIELICREKERRT